MSYPLFGVGVMGIMILSILAHAARRRFLPTQIIWGILPLSVFLITTMVLFYLPDKIAIPSKLPFLGLLLILSITYIIYVHVKVHRNDPISVVGASHALLIWAVLLLLWELAAGKYSVVNPIYFPPPSKVIGAFLTDAATFDLFLRSMKSSTIILFAGWTSGCLMGITVGLLIGWWKKVEKISVPIVKIVAPIPATAWIPIAIVALPTLQMASIFVLWIAAFFPSLYNTYGGVKSVTKQSVEMARVLGANDATILRRVVIPAALPSIFIGVYFALILNLIALIPAEMVGVEAGIGWFLSFARGWSRYDLVFACMFTLGLICLAITSVLDIIKGKLLRWQKGVVR